MKILRRPFFGGGRSVPAKQAEELADFITKRIHQDGLDMDDVCFAIDAAFPELKFHIFAGALMLYRCQSGEDGYAMVLPPEKLQ